MDLPKERRQEILDEFKKGMTIKEVMLKHAIDEDSAFGVIWINMQTVKRLREVSV